MKPKPFWLSNHLHVPLSRSFAPVQNDARIGANMADLPDHIARDFAIAIVRAKVDGPERGVARNQRKKSIFTGAVGSARCATHNVDPHGD